MQRQKCLSASFSALRCLSVRSKSSIIIKNPSACMLPMKGRIAEPKPVKMELEEGKLYRWCSCGLSPLQPWCNNECEREGLTMLRPVEFQVEKSGVYSLCNCKNTENRPLCDGNHKYVSKRPRSLDASRVAIFQDSPAYHGVAYKLGYKPKNGGFQQ